MTRSILPLVRLPPTAAAGELGAVPDAHAAETSPPSAPLHPAPRRQLFWGALATAGLSLLFAAWALRLWDADLSIPLRFVQVDDTKFYLSLVKGVLEHGWFQSNPSLGAPFGQQLYDFPQGADNLNFLIIKGLGVFSSNAALVTNLFLLLTFPLTSVSAYLVLRRLGISSGPAIVSAVIFALLPYHFNRGESHLLLSAYYSIPLAAYLFLELLGGERLFERRAGDPPRALAWTSKRTLATVAVCLVIGSAGLYYAVFALVMLGGATVAALVARRGRGAVLSGVALVALVGAMLVVNLAPSLLYQGRHGGNPQISRTTLESEQLGLKLTHLLLPVRQHRLPLLSDISADYSNATSPAYCESCYATLGTVGDVGFLWLCLGGLALVLGTATALTGRRLFRDSAAGVALAFVIGTIGGVSGLIAFFVTANIRGWNRISLFIAFFSLLAVAMLLQAAATRLTPRPAGPNLARALLVVVLMFGVFDETTNYFVPPYAAIAREYRSDARFVAAMEHTLPPRASVFQLPYVPFPEGYAPTSTGVSLPSPTLGSSYELARGYIQSHSLRWSYGAMKGRPADWQAQLAAKPLGLAVPAAAAAGFQGIYVDPRGYHGRVPAQVMSTLRTLLGVPPLLSPNRDLWFFDMRPYIRRLQASHTAAQLQALRDATLRPLRVACATARLDVDNPYPDTRMALLTAFVTPGTPTPADPLATGAPSPTRVLVSYPDGSTARLSVTAAPVRIEKLLALPPGHSLVRFGVPRGTPQAGPQVAQATLTEGAFAPFADATARVASGGLASGLIAPPCALGTGP